MSVTNDPNVVRRQYATDERIRIRHETHEKYSIPKIDFAQWALSCPAWRGDETVLDVGCGTGNYYTRLQRYGTGIRYYGLDFSPGMLLKHPAERPALQVADAMALPYTDHSFDLVMANHMLYHVANIDQALREFRRVLKPNGVLMVATNSQGTMPELQVLMRRAIILLTRSGASQVQPPIASSELFALENGTRYLSHYFYGVVRYDLPSAFVFREIDPLIAYLDSMRDLREPQLPSDVAWEDVMTIMRQQVTHLIHHIGEFVINKLAGVLLASDNGGFIQEFSEHLGSVRSDNGLR
ncbi:MAG: class I SAM-dependent methyltransferase [Anaerolineae bacterium]|jgi:SAM-dependent methyltransferase|nr:class I SAM-dependent methyltransferase [Anaerolineae bacterium]